MFGTEIGCEPSLAVVASTKGKLWPPSVESRILTLGVLIAPAAVPATSQVMVCDVAPVHVTAVFGDNTAKGAPVFTTLTRTSSELIPPRPSRTVARKLRLR